MAVEYNAIYEVEFYMVHKDIQFSFTSGKSTFSYAHIYEKYDWNARLNKNAVLVV